MSMENFATPQLFRFLTGAARLDRGSDCSHNLVFKCLVTGYFLLVLNRKKMYDCG